MLKRIVFAQSGRGRFNRRLLRDERGLTPVIGAVLVISLVTIAISVYLGQVVPAYLRHNEMEHMNSVRGAFFDLQMLALSHKDGTINIPMSPKPTPLFSLPPTSSKVEVTPARWVKRFMPTDDAYVEEGSPTANFNDENVLSVRSYKPPGGSSSNRRVYIKFDVATEIPGISPESIAEAWLVLYCENIPKFMGRTFGDNDYEISESGSWLQTDWSGGPGQVNWLYENRYDSSDNIDDNIPGEIRLQLQAPGVYLPSGGLLSSIYDAGSPVLWGFNKGITAYPSSSTNIYVYVRFSNDGIFDGSETMESWREIKRHERFDFGTVRARYVQYSVELRSDSAQRYTPIFKELWLLNVDQFYLPDIPIAVEAREVTGTWSQSTITWNTQSSLTIGETITAMDFPYEDNHMIKDNEAWFTWDVTSWVRDRIDAGDSVSVLLQAVHENSTIERYASFSSREDRENVLFVAEPHEIDKDDADDKTTGHPPYSKPHLAVIYENGTSPGPSVLDDWGAFIEGGSVRFETDYREFPSHSFIFESGALFQQQFGFAYEFMISDPGLVVGERLDNELYGDSIAVYLNRYRIVNWDRLTTSADARLIVTVRENTDDYVAGLHYPIDNDGNGRVDPNRENVFITVRSGFEWPWKYYFRDLTYRWNSSASKGGLEWWVKYYENEGSSIWSGNVVEFIAKEYIDRNIRLYIWGRVENPSVKDILYYDRTYDVEVKIGV